MKKVLICSPLRVEPKIFKEHKKSLDALIVPEGYKVDYFWVVNNCDEVVPLLDPTEYVVINTDDKSYTKDEAEHNWSRTNMYNMGELRTICMYQALANGYDYCFFVDTDLILKPETLKTLIEADKDIVAEGFWTMGKDGNYWINAWEVDNYGVSADAYARWKQPGLYQVGMAGACTLIKRRVIESGVTYKKIPNLQDALIGEDRFFCVRAACHGFDIWLDTHCEPAHLYRESEYQKYMREKYNA